MAWDNRELILFLGFTFLPRRFGKVSGIMIKQNDAMTESEAPSPDAVDGASGDNVYTFNLDTNHLFTIYCNVYL